MRWAVASRFGAASSTRMRWAEAAWAAEAAAAVMVDVLLVSIVASRKRVQVRESAGSYPMIVLTELTYGKGRYSVGSYTESTCARAVTGWGLTTTGSPKVGGGIRQGKEGRGRKERKGQKEGTERGGADLEMLPASIGVVDRLDDVVEAEPVGELLIRSGRDENEK